MSPPSTAQRGGRVDAVTDQSPHTFAVTSSSQKVLPSNANRAGSEWVNDSSVKIYLGLGAAAVVGSGIGLAPGSTWNGCVGPEVFTGDIYAIAASGSGNTLTVEEV